jgi:mRNA-degrading endonuclease toxin of MazEF toxin-antitoxin module
MADQASEALPRRGEVYLVAFDPTLGAEIKKTRPALILQNDIANRHSSITVVAAITSQFEGRLYPTEVLVKKPEGRLRTDSAVLLNQKLSTASGKYKVTRINVLPVRSEARGGIRRRTERRRGSIFSPTRSMSPGLVVAEISLDMVNPSRRRINSLGRSR